MASLVANYGSDSENSTDSGDVVHATERKEDNKVTNFFNDENSSDSDSDDDHETDLTTYIEEKSAADRLPNPLASLGETSKLQKPQFLSSSSDSAKHSVFINQFRKAEEAKLSVLEQHVKLTNTEIPEGTGRKVCKSFRKGKCRYGKKCKYLHVMDPLDPPKSVSDEKLEEKSSGIPEKQHNYYGRQSFRGHVQQEEVDDDSYMGQAKRKFRAGVSDTLRPPKKALKSLEAQRHQERPWTAKSNQT